ncbi:hypothetical protein V8C44DRAFT_236603 [Trichoderma aethiopicum]
MGNTITDYMLGCGVIYMPLYVIFFQDMTNYICKAPVFRYSSQLCGSYYMSTSLFLLPFIISPQPVLSAQGFKTTAATQRSYRWWLAMLACYMPPWGDHMWH